MFRIREGELRMRVGRREAVRWVGQAALTAITAEISQGVCEAKGMKSLLHIVPAVPPTLLIRRIMGRGRRGERAEERVDGVADEASRIRRRLLIRG